jgi:hypothetical protein
MQVLELKIARIQAGLCKYQVAACLGIPQTRPCEIELGKATPAVPDDMAFKRVVGSTAFVLDQLELNNRQTREQAQGWFHFSLIAACVGFALFVIGVITVIFGQTTAGLITVISSVILEVVAALFFAQSKAANERVDTIQAKLTEAREVQTAVEIVNTISDPTAQDNLKAEIVRKTLRLEQSASDSRLTPASVS